MGFYAQRRGKRHIHITRTHTLTLMPFFTAELKAAYIFFVYFKARSLELKKSVRFTHTLK